jgi:hypothetical protein
MLQEGFKPGGLVSALVTYQPGASIRFSSYFPYQAGFGIGHFHTSLVLILGPRLIFDWYEAGMYLALRLV